MDPWSAFEHATRQRHGVSDVALARHHGVAPARYYDRTGRERWGDDVPGLRIHPASNPSVKQRLTVVAHATRVPAGASQDAAAWLHGLRDRPPRRPTVAVQHTTRAPRYGKVAVHRARWLRARDVVEVDQVPTLALPAMFVTSCGVPADDQRRRLIDALHRRLVTADAIIERLADIGPVTGKRRLLELCLDLRERAVESIFQEDVAAQLVERGYGAERSTRRIDTPDGRGLTVDIALPAWQVALEPEGDAFHRTREQRRLDRRRMAAYAGTVWTPVPIDWRDWHLDRDGVLDAIDAAIAAQRARGIGAGTPPPRRRAL